MTMLEQCCKVTVVYVAKCWPTKNKTSNINLLEDVCDTAIEQWSESSIKSTNQ
jgi:hypothetical protein